MNKPTVGEVIYQYLNEHKGEWHAGFEFVNRSIGIKSGTYFLGSSADRKARRLAEDGKIERTYKTLDGVRYAYYRVKPDLSEGEMFEMFEPKAYPQAH